MFDYFVPSLGLGSRVLEFSLGELGWGCGCWCLGLGGQERTRAWGLALELGV